MTYTEIQERNGKKYYYRVKSVKIKGKVSKERVYLGKEINKDKLKKKEIGADKKLNKSLSVLLTDEETNQLKVLKKKFKTIPNATFNNRYEAFVSKFTYDSNAIEGNTITLQETSYLLFENKTPPGKSMREINEVLNHKKAFDFMLNHKGDINKSFICNLQKIVTQDTLRKDLQNQIGKYRTLQVYIRGTEVVPTNPKEVNMEMRTLLRWYNKNKKTLHPIIIAAYFHVAFEAIHPFVDGNGRTGRLLLNFILHRSCYPMINIPNKRKLIYYDCLEEGQLKNNLRKFVKFLYMLIAGEEVYI